MRATIGRQAIAAALLITALAGCGLARPAAQLPTAAPAPTGQPATTAAPAAATARPAATAAPAAGPAFSFEPRGGAPGTVVAVRGWGHQPDAWVGVFLGVPGPVGTALASAQADAAGRWEARVTIPGTLPDGAPVPARDVFLVTMDAQFRPQASAPFAYQAPARPGPQIPPLQQARDNVETLLLAYGTAEIRDYLGAGLRRPYEQGRPLPELLGFDPLRMQGKPEIGQPQQRPGRGAADVGVTVTLPGERQHYIFSMLVEDGYWKLAGAQFLRSEPVHQPFPGPGWVDQIVGDYTGDGVDERYLVRAEQPAAQVSFGDPYLDHNSRPTAAVMVAQVGPHNVNVLLSADAEGVRSGAAELATFPYERAAGYLIALDRRGPFLVYLQPLRADGASLAPVMALAYDQAAAGFRPYAPPVDRTPASEPGRQDAVAIGQLALDYTRASSLGDAPIVAGAVATAGEYALAVAQPAGGQVQFIYLRRQGGSWQVLLATAGTTPEVLRASGIPQSLEMPQPMIDLLYGTLAYFNSAPGRAADGYALIERVDGRHARVTLRDASQGDITVYLHQPMGWEVLIAGQVFAPEELDRLGIPASVRG